MLDGVAEAEGSSSREEDGDDDGANTYGVMETEPLGLLPPPPPSHGGLGLRWSSGRGVRDSVPVALADASVGSGVSLLLGVGTAVKEAVADMEPDSLAVAVRELDPVPLPVAGALGV